VVSLVAEHYEPFTQVTEPASTAECQARQGYPERACFRTEPHPWHTHVNESPQGGCGLPEFCPGAPEPASTVRWMIVAGEPDAHCVTDENAGRRGWRPLCQQSDVASDVLLREARDGTDSFCGTCRDVYGSRVRMAIAKAKRNAVRSAKPDPGASS
jgi:hypothetical protein